MPTYPSVGQLLHDFPSGKTRGGFLDYLRFHSHKAGQHLMRRIGLREITIPHRRLLTAAVKQVLTVFPDPVCVETGCIRKFDEGTDSTLAIASALNDRGRLLTFELEPAHIEICKSICSEFNHRITYVQGDAKENLRQRTQKQDLQVVHFAFFDSADDPDQIFEEFSVIEGLFVPGSMVIVDDVVAPSVKGAKLMPYLHRHPLWETYLLYVWKGLLLAIRRTSQ